jgi:hypothetical protein
MGLVWDPTLGQCLLDDTRLASISHLDSCSVLPSSREIIKHRLRVWLQHHVLLMVHLTYLNEV